MEFPYPKSIFGRSPLKISGPDTLPDGKIVLDITSRLFLWTVLAAVLVTGISSSLVEPAKPSGKTLMPLLPQAATVEFKTDPVRHYQGTKASGSPAGSIVLSEDNGPTTKGYMGEIVAAVGIDAAAVIRGVTLCCWTIVFRKYY